MASSPSGGSGSFLPLQPSRCGPAGIFLFYSMSALFHFGLWTSPVSYVFPLPALVPLVLSKVLAEHVNSQLRHLILVVPCWTEASWLPAVLNMLTDVPLQSPIVKDLVVDVLVGQALRCL